MARHSIPGEKVHLCKRPDSPIWQCLTYLAGRNRRVSTKETNLAAAKNFAQDWFLALKGKKREGTLEQGVLFKVAAEQVGPVSNQRWRKNPGAGPCRLGVARW